jgi:hypothetical protein
MARAELHRAVACGREASSARRSARVALRSVTLAAAGRVASSAQLLLEEPEAVAEPVRGAFRGASAVLLGASEVRLPQVVLREAASASDEPAALPQVVAAALVESDAQAQRAAPGAAEAWRLVEAAP